MSYVLNITKKAYDEIEKLEKDIQKRIINKLKDACINPFHFCERLVGYDFYKLRIGDYRAVLDISREKQMIIVHKVGHRRNIYKNMHL